MVAMRCAAEMSVGLCPIVIQLLATNVAKELVTFWTSHLVTTGFLDNGFLAAAMGACSNNLVGHFKF